MKPALKHQLRGFTLIELMVVVAIVGILAAIAYPSYISSVTKANRAAAKSCLSEYAQFMDRFYTTNFAYDKDSGGNVLVFPALGCSTESNLNQRYTFTVDTLARNTFRVLATPTGSQLAQDTQCGTLTLDQTGNRTASGTDGGAVCW